jgi:hypothetical protein
MALACHNPQGTRASTWYAADTRASVARAYRPAWNAKAKSRITRVMTVADRAEFPEDLHPEAFTSSVRRRRNGRSSTVPADAATPSTST